MSVERADGDMSDISVSESSWADAQADTPTMGEGRSDSEDTLSNLSFDNDNEILFDSQGAVVESPVGDVTRTGGVGVGGGGGGGGGVGSGNNKGVDEVGSGPESRRKGHGQTANVRVQINDFEMDDDSLHLNLQPGAAYKPPSVDFPTSPSQLKNSQGPSFMPKEEPGAVSEDESSVNSYRAHLDLNGGVRLTKRGEDLLVASSYLRIPKVYESSVDETEPESLLLEDTDGFDDYIEDFYNPLSNEPVMQRATSFRRKVQKQLEDAVVEKSIREINNLEAMLSAYDSDDENDNNLNDIPEEDFIKSSTPECPQCKKLSSLCSKCKIRYDLINGRNGTSKSNRTLVESEGRRMSSIQRMEGHPDGETYLSEFSNGSSNNSSRSGSGSGDNSNSKTSFQDQKHLFNNSVTSSKVSESDGHTGFSFGKGPDAHNQSRSEHEKERKKFSNIVRALSFEDHDHEDSEPQSLLDIDAICKANAPNLMNSIEPQSLQIFQQDDEASNYFIPKDTLNKIESVFESNNFNNLYTLSGELKHILSPVEIEEIVANKEQLASVLSPNVMAALSWSLNESSLPTFTNINHNNNNNHNSPNKIDESTSFNLQNNLHNTNNGLESSQEDPDQDLPLLIENTKDDGTNNCFSSATSLSNGFHSKESSLTDVSDQNELEEHQMKHKSHPKSKKMVPVKDSYGVDDEQESKHNENEVLHSSDIVPSNIHSAFQRGTNVTNSFRRKIALGKQVTSEDLPQKYVEDNNKDSSQSQERKNSRDNNAWKSLESLDDLEVEDEIDSRHDSENGDDDTPKMFFVRRDSKRFNKGVDADRVIQGLFLESKNINGTLKRLKVPLNIDDCNDSGGDKSLETGLENTSAEEFYSPNGDVPNGHDSDAGVKSPHKKRISVDDKILSIASELDDSSAATDVTQSDVFHSIINSPRDEDRTIRSDEGDDEDITLDIDTPDDMEDSILEQLDSVGAQAVTRERIPELRAEEELEDERRWKSFRVGASDIQIDLQAIQPYRRTLSHGGYFDAERKVAIILFSGCFLPDRSRKEYAYLMDHLFLYVLSSLEELIVEDYILVYLHGATPKSCMPTFSWLKRCYQLIDHRLRKNLKGLYLVHPTFWLKTVVALTKPFVSTKFSRKLQFVNTLADLCLLIPTEHLVIPDRVLHYDFELKLNDLRRQNKLS